MKTENLDSKTKTEVGLGYNKKKPIISKADYISKKIFAVL